MVSDLKANILKCKVDLLAKCGKKIIAKSVMCTKSGKWVYGRCTKMKRASLTLAKVFVHRGCVEIMKRMMELEMY